MLVVNWLTVPTKFDTYVFKHGNDNDSDYPFGIFKLFINQN